MRVTLEKDEKCNVDIELCQTVLNQLCTSVSFAALPVRHLDKQHSTPHIDLSGEFDRIGRLLTGHDSDRHFYLTRRPHHDNYFVHQSGRATIVSFAHWEEYTSLPEENGFLHCIARYTLLGVRELKHECTTGCVFDFHWRKSDIDFCMREGRICPTCGDALKEDISASKEKASLCRDAVAILEAVANTSRLGRSVYSILTDSDLTQLNWETFEDFVGDYYRSIGASVEQRCNLAGFEIDLLAAEVTPSGLVVRTAVECKFHKNRVGNRTVNDFARVLATVKDAELADAGTIVSYAGFTQDARLAAKHAGVSLIHYKDIQQRLRQSRAPGKATREPPTSATNAPEHGIDKMVFVIMPFSSDLDDLYFFGIQSAVKDCGAVCVRLDQEQFNGGILEEIYKNIRRAAVIIAEVTRPNPNVYYEIGCAHAMKREVVLLASQVDRTAFDISGFNHIIYSSIKDLGDKLRRRLGVLLEGVD